MNDHDDHHLDYLLDEKVSAGLVMLYGLALAAPVIIVLIILLAITGAFA